MPRHSFLILVFLLVCVVAGLVNGQGVSKTGKKDGNALYSAAKKVKAGNYAFRSYSGKQYLTFVSSGNLVVPKTSGQRIWKIKNHGNTKYFSAHGNNKAGNDKCISTRWTTGNGSGGYPDAAVLWQCEVDVDKKKKDTGGYDPIFPPKQLWLVVPSKKHKGWFKIVSASHLFDMIPRCIQRKNISGGTKLAKCKIDTEDTSMMWKMVKA